VNASSSLDDAKKTLSNKITSSYIAADDAIRNSIDQLFTDPKTNSPKFIPAITDFQLNVDINNERIVVEKILNDWSANDSTITSDVALDNLNNQVQILISKKYPNIKY